MGGKGWRELECRDIYKMHYYSNNAVFAYLIVLKLRVAFQQNRNDGYLSLSVCLSVCFFSFYSFPFCHSLFHTHTHTNKCTPTSTLFFIPCIVWNMPTFWQSWGFVGNPFNGIYYTYHTIASVLFRDFSEFSIVAFPDFDT